MRNYMPLHDKQISFIEKLPAKFTRGEASRIAVENNLTHRYFDVAIRKKKFSEKFHRVDHGVYIKL